MVELDNGIKIRVGYDGPKTEERIDKLMNIAKNGVVANVKTVVEGKDVKSLEKQLSNVSSNIDTKELTKSITSAIKEGLKEITDILKGKGGNYITVNFNPQQIVDAYNSAIKQINPNKINPVKVQVEADSDTIKKEIKKASTTKNKSKPKKTDTEIVESSGTKVEKPKQKIDNSKRHDFTPVFASQSGFNKLKKNKSAVDSLNNYGLALKTGNIPLINSTSDELENQLNKLKIKFEKKEPERGYVLREKINKQSLPDKENSELIKSLREISLDNFDREFIIATNNLRDELNKSFNNDNIVNALKETEKLAKSKGIDFDFSEYIKRYNGELGEGDIEKVSPIELSQNLSSDTKEATSNYLNDINKLRLDGVRQRKEKQRTRKPTIISDTEEDSAATSFVKPYYELAEDLRKSEIYKKVKKSDSRYKDIIDVVTNLRTDKLKKSFDETEMRKLFSQRIYEVFNGENIDIDKYEVFDGENVHTKKKLSEYIGKYEGKPITKGIAINNDEEQRMEEISEIIKAGGISEDEKKSLLDEFGSLKESRLSGFKTAGKYYKEAVNRISIFEQNMGESASDFYTIVDNIYSASKEAIKNKDKEKASELLLDLTNMVASTNGDDTKLNYLTNVLTRLKHVGTEKVIKSEIGSTGFTGDIPKEKLSRNPTIKAKQLVENLKDDIDSGVKPDIEKFEEEYNKTRERVANKQKRELKRGKNGAFISTTKSISATDSEKNAILKELSKNEKDTSGDISKNIHTNHIKFEDFKRLIDLSNSQKPAEFEEFNKYLNENANVNELFKSYGKYFEGITTGVKAEQLSWFEELSPKFGIKPDATESNVDSLLKRLVYSVNNKDLVGYDKNVFTTELLNTIDEITAELSRKDVDDNKLVEEIVKETKTKKPKKQTQLERVRSIYKQVSDNLINLSGDELESANAPLRTELENISKTTNGRKTVEKVQDEFIKDRIEYLKTQLAPNNPEGNRAISAEIDKLRKSSPSLTKAEEQHKKKLQTAMGQMTDTIFGGLPGGKSTNEVDAIYGRLKLFTNEQLESFDDNTFNNILEDSKKLVGDKYNDVLQKIATVGAKRLSKQKPSLKQNTQKKKSNTNTKKQQKTNEVDSIYGRLKLFTSEQLSSFDDNTFNKILDDSKKLVGEKYNDVLQKVASEALNRVNKNKVDVSKLSDEEIKTKARDAWGRKVANKPSEPDDNDVIVENEKRIEAKAGSKATIGIDLNTGDVSVESDSVTETTTKPKKRDISRYEAMVSEIENLFGATSDLAKKAKFYLSTIEQFGFRAGGGDELNKIFKDKALPEIYKREGITPEENASEEKPAWYKRLGAFGVGVFGSMVQGASSKFFGLLQGLLNKVKGLIMNLMKNIISAAINPFKKSVKLFTNAIKSAGGKSKALSSLSELLIMPLVLAVEFTMLPVLRKLIPAIKDTMNWVVKSKDKFTLLGEAIANVANKVYNMLTGNFVLGFEKFFGTLTKYKTEIDNTYSEDSTFFTNLNNAGVSLKNISTSLGTVATVADNLNKELADFGKDNPEYGGFVTAFADEIGEALFTSITTSTDSIWTAFETVLENDEAYSHMQSFIEGLIKSLGQNIETTSKIGAEFVSQLVEGINNYLNTDAGKSTLTNISKNISGIISNVMSSVATEVIPTVIKSGAVTDIAGATAPLWLTGLGLSALSSGVGSGIGTGIKTIKNKILTGSTTGGIATNLGKSSKTKIKTGDALDPFGTEQKATAKESNMKNLNKSSKAGKVGSTLGKVGGTVSKVGGAVVGAAGGLAAGAGIGAGLLLIEEGVNLKEINDNLTGQETVQEYLDSLDWFSGLFANAQYGIDTNTIKEKTGWSEEFIKNLTLGQFKSTLTRIGNNTLTDEYIKTTEEIYSSSIDGLSETIENSASNLETTMTEAPQTPLSLSINNNLTIMKDGITSSKPTITTDSGLLMHSLSITNTTT